MYTDIMDPQTQPPQTPEPKHFPFIQIFLAFLVLLLAAVTAYLAYKNMQLQKQIAELSKPISIVSPKPTVKADDPTANWKTYKDDVYKFEIKYLETNSDYVKGLMPVKQYLDNDLNIGYRLLLLRNTLKKQFFRVKIQKINQQISLLDYWKSDSDVAQSGLIFSSCNLEKCSGSYKNSSKSYEFNLQNNDIEGLKALTVGVTIPSEFQETIMFKLNDDYIMEIDKGIDDLSNQILSTFELTN